VRESVDLVITVKTLDRAKSRLLGAADHGAGDRAAHEALALALVRDTAAAASATPNVRRVLVVTSDPTVADALAGDGRSRPTPDAPGAGLNAAVAYGADVLLRADPGAVVAVLQSDLPALRTEELAKALAEAGWPPRVLRRPPGHRARRCWSPHPAGRWIPTSAPVRRRRNVASGAALVGVDLPTLRCDVDSAEDLTLAGTLGWVGTPPPSSACLVLGDFTM